MKKTQVQPKLLKELEKTPIMSVACEKVGISRQTAYRWMKESKVFLAKVEEAMKHGVGLVNDVAESNILRGIKEDNLHATKYWLSHRHESFKKPFTYRQAGIDILELKRIQDFLRSDDFRRHQTEEEKQEKIRKAKAMLDKWKHFFPENREKK